MALPRPDRNAKDHPYQETEEEARERSERLVALLESWINVSEVEAEEQRETGEYLVKALDEDRPEDRKLFPEGWQSSLTRGRSA